MNEFGVPPRAARQTEKADGDPGTTSDGKPAARAAMHDVADGKQPGEDSAKELGATDLGSGNAPLGE